jgi:putative PEP-CTERM system histidine kinase
MGVVGWSHVLVGVAYSIFALRLIQQTRSSGQSQLANRTVIAAVLLSAGWGWVGLGFSLRSGNEWLALSGVMDILRYGAWYAFLLVLIRTGQSMQQRHDSRWMVVVAVLLTLLSLTIRIVPVFGVPNVDSMSRWGLLVAMASPVFALMLLEQVFRNSTDDSRWNIKPLSLGLAGAFLFDLYVFSQAVMFNSIDVDARSIRGAVHALVVPLLLLSITRRSDWVSKIRLSPKAAFHSATLFIAGLYLVFMSAIGYYVRYFGGEWGRALQVGMVFFALITVMVLAMSGSVRASVRVFLGKHFFRYRYDYREEWLKFTQTLSHRNSPQEMGYQVIRGLADMLESPGGGLWMREPTTGDFGQTARWNLAQTDEKEPAGSQLCEFMQTSGWVVNLEEYRSYSRRYGQLKLPVWLSEIPHAWLVVPLSMGDELIGFVVLASARTRVDVNWEVNDLLKTAGQQAASFLAQMQATEALLEVRKFDAFNKMSAFVVHDLKNIVTQLSLMMKNAKRLSGNPEFQQDMLMTVENSLERMRQLMLQLREGATPPGTPIGVNLEGIISRISAVAEHRGRKLEVSIGESVLARGHEERLERIVGHMVQNAFDATPLSGRVALTLDRAAGHARIVVTDTGQGMTAEFIRERLFKPFQTTKQAGMGIGAYESYQYVQELGGKIDVESAPGQGTTVTVLLPLFESGRGTEPRLLDAA